MTRLRPFAADDLYLLRVVGDPQLSPDGKTLAYVVADHDRDTDEVHTRIWVAATDGRTPARQFSSGERDHSPRWAPDGTALLFVGARGGKTGQLLLASLSGGEPRPLTTADSNVSQPAWSPDGTRIAYVTRVGGTAPKDDASPAEKRRPRVITHLKWRLDGVGVFDGKRAHVFVVDIETGTSKQVTRGDWDDDGPTWSPDGDAIAFVSDRRRQRHDEQLRSDLWVVSAAGGKVRRLTRARGSAVLPVWSPDGRWIAFIGGEHGHDFWSQSAHLLVINATEENGEPRSLGNGFARLGVPEGPALAWTARSDAVYTVRVERGAGVVRCFGLDGGTRAVLTGDRRIGALTLSADQKQVAFVATWVGEPSEAYVARLASGKATGERMISRANDELRGAVALAGCRRITSTAADGTESESFLLLPPRDAHRKGLPLVLDVHGGPHGWHPGTFTTTWAIAQTLAGAGYAVLLCNPRGSAGYGDTFLAGCVQDWGGGDFDDLMAAVDGLVADGTADREHLYVWGYSYGGFMTSWIVGHTSRFRAAVVGAPVVDQRSMIGTTDIPHFAMHELGGLPWDRPDEYAKRSPLTYAPDIRTPVLLLHQDGDLRCPIGQSDELFAALKLLGKEVEYVRYPGGFHALGVAPSHLVDRVARTVEWFARHR